MTGALTTARGSEVVYELRGEGPTIAFVNSMFMRGSGWATFTRDLVDRNRLLTYDVEPRTGGGGLDGQVDDLAELLDAAGVESAYVLGHSSATQACVAYAAARPERVRGLILVGPTLDRVGREARRHVTDEWRAAYGAGGLEALFDLVWPLVHSEATLRRVGEMGRRIVRGRFMAMNEGRDPLAALTDDEVDPTAVQAPTLLLTGADDRISTPAGLEEARGLIPDSRVVLVPDAGHVTYLEAPDAFQEEVQRFVDGVEASLRISSAAGA